MSRPPRLMHIHEVVAVYADDARPRYTGHTEATLDAGVRPHRHEIKWTVGNGVALPAEGHRHHGLRLSSGWTGPALRVAPRSRR